ncbi:MAG: hypothetical protein PHH14_00635 [Candidatus Margulisbacteria bacterium]|nr:hypothetical protein [Candidatus Margulisiibacteriota bacterium]
MPEIKTLHYPDEYKNIKTLRDEYVKHKYLLVSFEKIKDPSEAKKLKDYLLGLTYAKEGIVFQYKKHVLFSMLPNGDSKDTLNMTDIVWNE